MADIPEDAVMLYMEYDQRRYGRHPATGEPILPPICDTAICTREALASVRTSKERLAESRGWVIANVKESCVYESH